MFNPFKILKKPNLQYIAETKLNNSYLIDTNLNDYKIMIHKYKNIHYGNKHYLLPNTNKKVDGVIGKTRDLINIDMKINKDNLTVSLVHSSAHFNYNDFATFFFLNDEEISLEILKDNQDLYFKYNDYLKIIENNITENKKKELF